MANTALMPMAATDNVNVAAAMSGLSSHTRRAYRRWITRYLTDVNRDAMIVSLDTLGAATAACNLSVPQLKAWLGTLRQSNLGKQSITQAKSAIVWLAGLLADMGWVSHEIPHGLSHVKVPRAEIGQRAGTWLSMDEIRHLLLVAQGKGRNPAQSSRDYAIIVLMITCGLRRDEVAAAMWSDMALQGGNVVLRVHGKGEKLRIVKLPTMTIAALNGWRANHPLPEGNEPMFTPIRLNGAVVNNPVSDRVIWQIVRRATDRAGLRNISPHDLRRSFARGAYEAGVPIELIRQSLGHSNIATTEHYINATLELNRAATDLWADAIGEVA